MTLGYRFGKWLPHITYAQIDGKSSSFGAVGPGGDKAISCAMVQTTGGDCTPFGGAGSALFNFPVAVQSSITAGLRYELNDSAAIKIEHSVIDVETDQAKLSETNNPPDPAGIIINFGLFDTSFSNPSPTKKVGVTSIALDIIF